MEQGGSVLGYLFFFPDDTSESSQTGLSKVLMLIIANEKIF